MRHETHALGDTGLGRQLGDILAIQMHRALVDVQHAENRLHGGGFAGAVGADNDRNFALFHANGAVMQDIGATVSARHVIAAQITHGTGS